MSDLPRVVDKPWGHELWWAWTDSYVGKILHVRAGHRLSVQFHTVEALEDADVLEVSTPHLDDVVRLADSYGREGTSAP